MTTRDTMLLLSTFIQSNAMHIGTIPAHYKATH